MRKTPLGIWVLGFFAALAGFSWLFFGLRVLGFDWFGLLGNLPAFDDVGLWGWLATFTGLVWLLAAIGLWSLQPWARLFTMIIAGIGLFEAVIAFIQFPGTGVAFGMAILPALVLWYLHRREIRRAFGVEPETAGQAQAAPAPAATMADPVAAAAPAPVAAAVAAPAVAPAMAAEPIHHVNVGDVEGIGPAYGAKLAAVGIVTTDDLLAAGATRQGRENLARDTGISHDLIRGWVDKADLMRVPGIGAQYSDLLELAGVDSPAELSRRNAAHLHQTFEDAVAARPGTVRRIPPEAEIAVWIDQASKLSRVVEH